LRNKADRQQARRIVSQARESERKRFEGYRFKQGKTERTGEKELVPDSKVLASGGSGGIGQKKTTESCNR